MKIHQIAPPYIPVDPAITYGGIERVIFQLDKTLAGQGHQTSMSATRGSKPVGRLYETVTPVGIGDCRRFSDLDAFYLKLDHMAMSVNNANSEDFDVVQVHEENLFPFLHFIQKPAVYTIHSAPEEFWNPEVHPEIIGDLQDKNHNIVAVSRRIRDIYTEMGFRVDYVVHNGFDVSREHFLESKGDYLLSLGVIRPQKGQHIAIKVAENLGIPLVIAGNIGDENYFGEIKNHITHSIERVEDKLGSYLELPEGRKIVYAGHVNDRQKFPLFSHARAFLITSVIEDALPGVTIEAMATGTPVIGFNKGGIPEMIMPGRTGYVVENADDMTEAVRISDNIRPQDCRDLYEREFTAGAMTQRYLDVYREVRKNGEK